MHYWLMKSEPETFGLDDLLARPGQTEPWDGVRNYQARNMMRDQMRCGDQVLFYHSNCRQPGVVGVCEVVREGYPDPTAFDPDSRYYDPKSTPDKPRWFMVDVRFRRKFPRTVTLVEMKAHPGLVELWILRRGNRLSIVPVSEEHWRIITDLAG
ncbi:MAG: EVE domain-containing protein [Methylococcales bacterium]|nr:EVE domain-containing protein [Methylococcales bacterium]